MAIADSSEGKPVPKKFSLTTVLWKILILAFDAVGVLVHCSSYFFRLC